MRDKARETLEYVGLSPRSHDQLAINLAYGDQRRVEIARALASDPALLLLDEPTAGMNPQESARLTEFMERLRDERGLSLLLIEHDMKVVMGVSEHITVLDHGEKIAEGLPQEVRANERVIQAYLGTQEGRRWPCLRSPTSTPTTGTSRRSRASRWRSTRGRSSRCIGSNGAGKSTTLRSISGLSTPREGAVRFAGDDITHLPPQQIVKRGISLSPEGRHCFPRMTVRENLELGAYLRRDARVTEDMERVFTLFPRLEERQRQKAGTMSGGEQQMLAIGRALMSEPKLLLLDEPSMGIAPILVARIYETIREINKQGTTILLVEQNANYALGVSARGYVLETGRSRSATSRRRCARIPTCRRRTWAHDRTRGSSSPTFRTYASSSLLGASHAGSPSNGR